MGYIMSCTCQSGLQTEVLSQERREVVRERERKEGRQSLLATQTHQMKFVPGRHICTPTFFAALFTLGKKWKQPKCPPTDA